MHPVLFEIGPLQITFAALWLYGVLYVMGIATALYTLYWGGIRHKILLLPQNTLVNFLISISIGGILGVGLHSGIHWIIRKYSPLALNFGLFHIRFYSDFLVFGIDPPLRIRYYGLMYAVGITCGLFLIRREVHRKQIPLSDDNVINFVMLPVIGGIIGARLYYVIFNWQSYKHDFGEIIRVWHGGLAIHGGLIGGILVGWWLTRRYQLSFWKMADVATPSIILAQTFGRFGNFMNGDAHGLPTSMPWGLVFPPTSIAGYQFPDTPLHPTMLYEMASNFCIFLVLWNLRTRPWKDGFIFCLYLVLYSVGRFIISFFRADSLMLGPFRVAHVISIVMIGLGMGIIFTRRLWERTEHADS